MDTRPKHARVIEKTRDVYASMENLADRAGPRQRFFVEARKRDDGDVGGIVEER